MVPVPQPAPLDAPDVVEGIVNHLLHVSYDQRTVLRLTAVAGAEESIYDGRRGALRCTAWRRPSIARRLGPPLQEVRRFNEAIDAHTQAITIACELGDRHREGMALNNLGSALRHLRRFDKAISAHAQAITIFRELGDRHGETWRGKTFNEPGG